MCRFLYVLVWSCMFPTSSYQSPESHLMRDRLAPARLSVESQQPLDMASGLWQNQSLSGKRPLQILAILCMFPIATAGHSTMCKNIGIHHCSLATCVRILLVTELVCLHDGMSRVKHKQVYLSRSLSLCAKFCTKACHVTAPARIQPLRTVATAPGTSINKSCDGTPGTAETP